MKLRLALFATALLWQAPAFAGSSTITTKDASGATKTFVVTTDGSSQFVAQSVICDGTAAAQCAAVKAASTAPVATDPALVVTLSPNSAGLGVAKNTAYSSQFGYPQMGIVETTIASGTNGNLDFPSLTQTARAIRMDVTSMAGATLVDDPCKSVAKITIAIDQAADTQIIAGTANKKTYVCAIVIIAAAAEAVSLVSGTGTVCATNLQVYAGSSTDTNGLSFAANGGITFGNGDAHVMAPPASQATGDNVCIRQGGTSRLAGTVTYVQK